jgi:hypothetical protein
MIYFLLGELPWQGLKTKNANEKYEKIMEKKISTPVEVLCKGFPEELRIFLNYTRDLRFDDRPDYAYLKKLITAVIEREQIKIDYNFDWVIRKQELDKMKDEKTDKDPVENKKGSMFQNKTDNENNNNFNNNDAMNINTN